MTLLNPQFAGLCQGPTSGVKVLSQQKQITISTGTVNVLEYTVLKPVRGRVKRVTNMSEVPYAVRITVYHTPCFDCFQSFALSAGM
jgi:hypothetical protein